jgi:hypothetical protein
MMKAFGGTFGFTIGSAVVLVMSVSCSDSNQLGVHSQVCIPRITRKSGELSETSRRSAPCANPVTPTNK